jgi:hypothetical protein
MPTALAEAHRGSRAAHQTAKRLRPFPHPTTQRHLQNETLISLVANCTLNLILFSHCFELVDLGKIGL